MKPEDVIDASDLRPLPDDGINMNPHGDPPSQGEQLYDEIVKTIETGGNIKINGCWANSVNKAEWEGNPENEVLLILYDGDPNDDEWSEKITEEDLNLAEIKNGIIIIDGKPTTDGETYFDGDDIQIELYRFYHPVM